MESLAVRYRPATFEDIVGQDTVVKILKKQIETKTFSNCYIFKGSSGSGKTTSARAFANAINNGKGKPIEIDAASNNGVDNVRNIIEDAKQRSISSEYKIYIIDECHSLSLQGWQAFLKCIEEPPKYTIFIFCTTDPQKIPATILNRCMIFTFNKIPSAVIYNRLKFICLQEHFTNYEESIDYISKISKGQMRDAIANLEKVAAYNTQLDISTTLSVLGNYSYTTMFDLMNAIIDNNQAKVFELIDDVYDKGGDLKLFVDQLLTFTLDLLKYVTIKSVDIIQIPAAMEQLLIHTTQFENSDKYYSYVVDKLLSLKNMLKNDVSPKNTTEVMLLQICRCQ